MGCLGTFLFSFALQIFFAGIAVSLVTWHWCGLR